MKFFRFTSNECAPRRYAWAGGYGPISKMPFFEGFSDDMQEMKLASWKINESTPGINIDPGGREWSDVLGCGGGPPSVFFSERVIDSLISNGIPILRYTEMPIGNILSRQLRNIPHPKYFVLEVEPGLRIRSESVPIQEQIAARNEAPPRHISPVKTVGDLASWNGADLFSPDHGKSLTSIFCTEKVKKLAEREGWKNASFQLIETV